MRDEGIVAIARTRSKRREGGGGEGERGREVR